MLCSNLEEPCLNLKVLFLISLSQIILPSFEVMDSNIKYKFN